MIYTTLRRIKENSPCSNGWQKLLSFLNKTEADDEPLSLLTILESNGVEDCLWAFQCTDDNERIYRLMAADFAESVLHIYEVKYSEDNRPRLAIQAARDYANGLIDEAAWAAAGAAAGAAAWAAAWAAERKKQEDIIIKYLTSNQPTAQVSDTTKLNQGTRS
jgi:ABC-type branched-subunit amino acid transport system substrate-binding protein